MANARCRFPRAATLVLKRWLDANQANPYPTEGEKNELKDETGLSLTQISTWLANARKRGKPRLKRASSPIPMAGTPRATRQAHMDPFGKSASYQASFHALLTTHRKMEALSTRERSAARPNQGSCQKHTRWCTRLEQLITLPQPQRPVEEV